MDRGGPTLVVLAAGIGSRFGGIKQIEPVGPNGESLIDYSIYDALATGFGRILFVVQEGMEERFRERFGTIADRCELDFAFQRLDDLPPGFSVPDRRGKPWGTAHALLSCRGRLEAPFALINADDFYGRSAFDSLARSLSTGGGPALVGYPLGATLSPSGPVSRGICRFDDAGYLVEIVERSGLRQEEDRIVYEDGEGRHGVEGGAIASMNMWGLTPDVLKELDRRFPAFLRGSDLRSAEYQLPTVIGDLIREGRLRVRVLPTEEEWFGITYHEDLPRVRAAIARLIAAGTYPSPLFD